MTVHHPHRPHRLRSALWACVLIVSLLAGSLPVAGAPSPSELQADPEPLAPRADAPYQIYLPVVLKLGVASPGDGLLVSWDQEISGAGRTVLLRWRVPSAVPDVALLATTKTIAFTVQRRVAGTATWQTIGTAAFAPNATAMATLLGPTLTEQLRTDLAGFEDPLTAFEDPLTAQELFDLLRTNPSVALIVAQRYYQAALATGMGFLDPSAPPNTTLEYRVIPEGGTRTFEPATIPPTGNAVPVPTALREVWIGPTTGNLGQPGSTRPQDAAERYSWLTTQHYQQWDGTVYLTWDMPLQGVVNKGTLEEGRDAMNLAGYRVYRAPHRTTQWVSLNPRKDRCSSGPYCEMMVGASPFPEDGVIPAHHFQDKLHESTTAPADPYGIWDYKVCAVSLLGREVGCSNILTVDVRELTPPRHVDEISAFVSENQSQISISWTYSDTHELNPPLTFYVTRSPELTLAPEQWTPIATTQVPGTGPLNLAIVDTPPLDRLFWYRIQVRDNAGNWSSTGVPVSAARYTRTGPPFAAISYDQNCALNAMPLTLTGLDPAIQVVNVYRSFDPGGPYTLFERFIVQGGSVTIDDTFQPPDATFAYYRFQALDGHGNTSVERPYCAQLGDGPLVHPGPPAIDTDLINDPEIGTTLLVTPTGPTGGPNIVIDIARPGPTGLVTTTEEIKQPFESSDFNPGATVGITAAYAPADTITNSVTLWLRDVNNFLDTDRHLTDLGEMSTVQWMTDTTTGAHYVHLDIAPVDEPSPPVAIFRRADRAAWMQIDGVRSIQPMIYDDRSDLDPRHSYEYAVVLLSPDSYEMLGAYRPITLPALHATNAPPMRLSDRIDPSATLPIGCTYTRETLDDTILLANDWQITNLGYWVATRRECPDDMPRSGDGPNYAHLWGDGRLSNGSRTWSVEFFDIAVVGADAGTWAHEAGRIVAELNYSAGGTRDFKRAIGRVEFLPTANRAEATITLPPAITVERTGDERTHEVFGVFSNVTTAFGANALAFGKQIITVVDENLPWRVRSSSATISHRELAFGALAEVSERLAYTPVPGWPESNLAYLRVPYASSNGSVTLQGLQGTFSTGTGQRIDYRTSFPADLRINAVNGAELVIIDSAIDRGSLRRATAELNYDTAGTTIDYVTADAYCDGEPDNHFHLCKGRIGSFVPDPHSVPLTLGDNLIPIGENGQILSEVGLSSEIRWPSFSFRPPAATLYVAPAAFSGTPTTWAPLPAEVAWQRIDNPDESIEATYDPGINFQVVGAPVDYLFYDPATFDPSNYALYLRRGGVSGHLIMEDTTPRTNAYGYSENVQRIELLFIDNAIVPPLLDFITDLTLPYPSQITFPLEVTGCDDRNRPLLGVFRDGFTDARHRYWGFTEAPKSWVWGHTTSTEYTAEIVIAQPRIFTLQNSTAVVDGLVPRNGGPGAASIELTFTTEWFPDGDIGALRLLAPKDVPYRTGSFRFNLSAVKLSRYYSEPLNPDSLPSTLGIDLTHTMDTLPKELLTAAGALTGASLKACATGSSNFGDNCGFIVLDGDVEVDYFGRVKSSGLTTQAADFSIPALDAVYGQYAVAVNTILDVTKFVGMLSGYVPWIWPQINGLLDVNLPVKFLGNTQGGVIVGLYRNAPIAADNEFLTADAAGIIQIAWGGNTFQDQVGVFLGYGASQAAFRALAMNRPADTGELLPFTAWDDVKDDIAAWAPKFGYPTNPPGSTDSPVDLAQRVWPTWGTKDWALVHSVIEPVLKELDGDDAYGVTGVEPGTKLQSTALVLNTTSLSAVFRPQGAGIEITEFSGGGQGQFDIWAYQAWEVWDVDLIDVDVYLRVDWAGFRITRDGEIRLDASAHFNLIYDWGVDGTLAAIAVPAGDEWRFEGALDVAPIGLAGVSALELDGVFGSGPYEKPGGGYEQLFYYGGNVVGYFLESRVGGGFLYGVIPQESAILREGGFGEILDTLGDKPTYQGIYVYVFGEFPVADESCLLRAVVGGELRFWYFGSVWGGGISGYAHATVACLISARGQVDLGYARLDHGGRQWSRTCNNPGGTCDAFGGAFWIAVGVGWCEPSTWRSWRSRWWGDSWCYTFGAYVDLTYLSPGGIDYDWDLDFE